MQNATLENFKTLCQENGLSADFNEGSLICLAKQINEHFYNRNEVANQDSVLNMLYVGLENTENSLIKEVVTALNYAGPFEKLEISLSPFKKPERTEVDLFYSVIGGG